MPYESDELFELREFNIFLLKNQAADAPSRDDSQRFRILRQGVNS
jgi:hypothetical protein